MLENNIKNILILSVQNLISQYKNLYATMIATAVNNNFRITNRDKLPKRV